MHPLNGSMRRRQFSQREKFKTTTDFEQMQLEALDATELHEASKVDIEKTDETKIAVKKENIIENDHSGVKNQFYETHNQFTGFKNNLNSMMNEPIQ